MQAPLIPKFLVASIMLLASSLANAQSSLLSSLSTEKQDEIGRICLPVQFREGATAYRNCVQAELDLTSGNNTRASNLGNLSFDDKYAVQQACAKAGSQSSSNYQGCITEQVNALSTIPEPSLDELSEDEIYVIQQSCFGAQSTEGAAQYRSCLNAEVASLLSIPAVDTSKLDLLNKNALQLRCSSRSSTAAQYRECVATEFESIAGTEPNFLSTGTTVAARPATPEPEAPEVIETAQVVSNDAAQEVVAPVQEVVAQEIPAPTVLAEETPIQQAPVEEAPPTIAADTIEPDTALPADNTSSLVAQNTAGADVTVSAESAINSAADSRVISRPDLVQTLELQEQAAAQGIELPEETVAANTPAAPEGSPAQSSSLQNVLSKASAWGHSVLDKLASADRSGWLIIAGVLALPALLLGVFSITKRFGRTEQQPYHSSMLHEQVESGLHTRRIRQEREADELFGEIKQDAPAANEMDATAVDPSATMGTQADDTAHDYSHNAPTRLAAKPQRQKPLAAASAVAQPSVDHAPNIGEPNSAVAAQSAAELPGHKYTSSASAYPWQSGFGNWLMQQPEETRLESCIEFLIYWVAYGDERYQRDLRKRLFTASDLSPHDEIKRWVLKQDVLAFADVIGWLNQNATLRQRDQSISLIMALLVTENGITPVQNTMLRFMSDAFSTGIDRLEKRFEKYYGHVLPPVPRPDNQAWWDKQPDSAQLLWDARTLATQPEIDQMAARLGLLGGYDEASIIQAFRRAARRCHPDRFSELGERELALAEHQYNKFEEARDKLLGVSV